MWGCKGIDAWYCGLAMDHYRNSKFFVPATKAYRISGSFDLFPQHCILPTFTPEQHVEEVHPELFESAQHLTKPAKKTFLHKMAKALQVLTETPVKDRPTAHLQTSEGGSTSADEATIRRVNTTEVTTTNEPTDARNLLLKSRTHDLVIRYNVPRKLPAIVRDPNCENIEVRQSQRLAKPIDAPIFTVTQPTSSRFPLHAPNIIDFQAVNHLTNKVFYKENKIWYPGSFLTSIPNTNHSDYDCDIEHMCAGVTHPDTGENITKY